MIVTTSPLDCILICDECEDEIIVPDSRDSTTGCCRSCGIAYVFDVPQHEARTVLSA